MEICYSGNDTRLARLLKSDFFHKLVDLLEVDEAPTLRQLKAAFSQNIDHDLDYLIKNKIVSRKERRYFLLLAIKHYEEDQEIIEKWTKKIETYSKYKSWKEKKEFLIQLSLVESQEMYLFDTNQPYASFYSLENDKIKISSLSIEKWPQTIPAYFSFLKKPEAGFYEEALQLLGDVNEDYFLNQIWMVLDKLETGKKQKETIFLRSLYLFGIVENKTRAIKEEVVCRHENYSFSNSILKEFQKLTEFQQRSILGAILEKLEVSEFTIVYKRE
ncbi:MAG TPA: DUF1803 domain-containing protein [Candidatus Tetragenococcus pullicola]|nr:DUF1803 domain-containing protein [Candidatus Tetragenococcus pullicola]